MTMATTIQVQKETVQLLRRLKEEKDLTSYDEVILELIKESKSIGRSQVGKYPKLKPFKREKIERI